MEHRLSIPFVKGFHQLLTGAKNASKQTPSISKSVLAYKLEHKTEGITLRIIQ